MAHVYNRIMVVWRKRLTEDTYMVAVRDESGLDKKSYIKLQLLEVSEYLNISIKYINFI